MALIGIVASQLFGYFANFLSKSLDMPFKPQIDLGTAGSIHGYQMTTKQSKSLLGQAAPIRWVLAGVRMRDGIT